MLNGYRQRAPFSVQVEPTEGCNLRCGFCAIRSIRAAGTRDDLSGPYHCMTLHTAEVLAGRLMEEDWHPRLEFAMRGEPTVNPDLVGIAALLRHSEPSRMLLTSNGIPMLDDWEDRIDALFQAGFSTIAIDDYKPYRCREAVLGTKIPGISVYRYPEDGPIANPHRGVRRHERRLVLVRALDEADSGTHSTITNQGGGAAPLDFSMAGHRCALPFREMSIRFDGNVALCCNDWRGYFKAGSIHDMSLDEIWNGEAFTAARERLYHGRRDFVPCRGCNYRSYRPGLLPDAKGLLDLPDPGEEVQQAITDVLSGQPYTVPVLRSWEK